MTAYPPPPDRATWVQPPPERRRPAWHVWLALGIVAVVLGTVGGGIAVVTALTREDPRDVVAAYMDAIAAGDVVTVNELTVGGAGTMLPDPTSMEGTTGIVVQGVGLASPESDTDRVYHVDFTIGGEDVLASVAIVRPDADGEWRVLETLARRVDLSTSGAPSVQVAIGGASTEPAAVPIMPVLLYPGAYTGVVTTQERTAADDLAFVVSDQDLELRIEPYATDDAVDEVVALATDVLDACLQESTRASASCDEVVVISDAASAADVSWRLDGEVTVQTRATETPWAMTIAATAVATYADRDGAVVEQRIPVETDARVDVAAGGAITATFDWTSNL